jgi:hypothetical protein
MKLIARSLLALLFSIALSMPASAQNPAVRMTKGPSNESVNFTLKNLSPVTIGIGSVEFRVYDQSTCKLLCAVKRAVNKKITKCQTLDWEVRCNAPVPAAAGGYIYYLRVRNASGTSLTESWLFVP